MNLEKDMRALREVLEEHRELRGEPLKWVYLCVDVCPKEPNNRVDGTLVALDVVDLVRLQRFATDDAWYFEIATTGNGGNNSIVVMVFWNALKVFGKILTISLNLM